MAWECVDEPLYHSVSEECGVQVYTIQSPAGGSESISAHPRVSPLRACFDIPPRRPGLQQEAGRDPRAGVISSANEVNQTPLHFKNNKNHTSPNPYLPLQTGDPVSVAALPREVG